MHWLEIVEWATRGILALLVLLSLWSFSIILGRFWYFRGWRNRHSLTALQKKIQNQELDKKVKKDPRYQLMVYLRSGPVQVSENLFKAFVNEQNKKWRQGLSVLGTLGSTSPFIGLLGTVLGIIVAFGELSQGAGDMKVVMFSLAEALILTAVGLVVAIPAVIAFNLFNKKIAFMIQDLETTKELYLARTLTQEQK